MLMSHIASIMLICSKESVVPKLFITESKKTGGFSIKIYIL